MMMKTQLRFAVLVGVILAVGLSGCSQQEEVTPFAVSNPATESGDVVKSVATIINGWQVEYLGRSCGDGLTTFSYRVAPADGYDCGSLAAFGLELPECAPELAGYAPQENATIGSIPYADPPIDGIWWAYDVIGKTYLTYSISFPGEVPEGTTHATIQVGDATEADLIPGPCAGIDEPEFALAGSVFVDGDVDGAFDHDSESGLEDVVVDLVDEEGGVVATAMTDAAGAYTFMAPAGMYEVRIDLESYPDAFNATLADWFDPTTPLSVPVEIVDDDVEGPDFGFSPRAEEIIESILAGDIVTEGESRRYWLTELLGGITDSDRNDPLHDRPTRSWSARTDYTPEELNAFLNEIEMLGIPDPFQFSEGLLGFIEARWILRGLPRNDDIVVLKSELLATEFNYVSGRGISGEGDNALLLGLIKWGEALVAEAEAADGQKRATTASPDKFEQDPIKAAIDLFGYLNTGGGGGVDE
jgi:hypothetical protein